MNLMQRSPHQSGVNDRRHLRRLIWVLVVLLWQPTFQAAAQIDPAACPTSRPAASTLSMNEGTRELGHTIARHVGRTDQQLQERLNRDAGIPAVSTFPDLATAQCVVDLVMADPQNQARINDWLTRRSRTLRLNYQASTAIGRVLSRDSTVKDSKRAVVILERASNAPSGLGYIILSAYPVADLRRPKDANAARNRPAQQTAPPNNGS